MTESIKVRAYDAITGEFVGEYESISIAARKLFIRYIRGIGLQIMAKQNIKRRGIKSYKDGRRYNFIIVK